MASFNELSNPRRRSGRRRLPPLEPGPALRFVVASHPDHFKAGRTMRHVRSHVMYKHRTERKTSNDETNISLRKSTSAHASSTPLTTDTISGVSSDDSTFLVPPYSQPRSSTWSGLLQEGVSFTSSPSILPTLIHQVVSTTAGTSARSAPPIFEAAPAFPFPDTYDTSRGQLDDVKQLYINASNLFCNDRQWMQYICSNSMLFLSHVSISCVLQDLTDRSLYDSNTTTCAKTAVLSRVADQLENTDATILSILHLLLSEAGGGDDSAFQVHARGLQGLIHRRGGMGRLPPQLATYATLLLITVTVLKRLPGSCALPTSIFTSHLTPAHHPYVSPLYAPHGNFTSLDSQYSTHTIEIVSAMYTLHLAFLNPNDNLNTSASPLNHHQIYTRLLHPHVSDPRDWLHETIRLAALIYTRALLHRVTFATAASSMSPDASTGATTLIHPLLAALEHTDITNCWGGMRGTFLWVCLVGGAAAWDMGGPDQQVPPLVAWARKCFSMWAIRAVVSMGFEHAHGTMEALKVAVRIRNELEGDATR